MGDGGPGEDEDGDGQASAALKMNKLLLFLNLLIALFLMGCASSSQTIDPKPTDAPYVGEWSNMRGEWMKITSTQLQFLDDLPVGYHELRTPTDGTVFRLQILSDAPVNYFHRYLTIELQNPDHIYIESYDTREDELKGNVSWQNWFRYKEGG